MSLKSIHPRTTTLVVMILIAAAFRLLQSGPVFSFMSNVTPVGAIALFGGCYFADKKRAFLVPLIVLWISDILLNRIYYFDHWTFYYGDMLWVYASFALTVMIGHLIHRVTVARVALAGIAAAVLHWFLSDFGLWASGGRDITTGLPFTPDFNGLMKCLYLALPYLRNMLIGNLVFCVVLFGAFEWIQRRYPSLQVKEAGA